MTCHTDAIEKRRTASAPFLRIFISITFPDDIYDIDEYAFSECASLTFTESEPPYIVGILISSDKLFKNFHRTFGEWCEKREGNV